MHRNKRCRFAVADTYTNKNKSCTLLNVVLASLQDRPLQLTEHGAKRESKENVGTSGRERCVSWQTTSDGVYLKDWIVAVVVGNKTEREYLQASK
ncbi:hypothetical protein J6590_104994 [Homalodisca vitripennis]|nr:hypothetical protein J6590_104994 [Homalodisca vitripennis]